MQVEEGILKGFAFAGPSHYFFLSQAFEGDSEGEFQGVWGRISASSLVNYHAIYNYFEPT